MAGRRSRHLGAISLGLSSALVPPAMAQPGGRERDQEHARVHLVAPANTLIPGDTNHIGILFDIDPGWHIYWDGVNESGFAPKVEWNAPPAVQLHPILQPAPTRYVGPGDLLDHVYEDQVLLIVPVDVPADARPGDLLTFRASIEYLVCQDSCIPGYADVLLTLPVASDGQEPEASDHADLFERTLSRIPQSWTGQDARFTLRLTRSSVEIDAQGATRLSYYPQSEAARPDDLLRRGVSSDGRLRLRLSPQDRGAVSRDPALRFVIEAVFPGEDSSVLYVIDRPLGELSG